MAAAGADGAHRMGDALDGQPSLNASLNASRHAAGQETLAAPARGDIAALDDDLTSLMLPE